MYFSVSLVFFMISYEMKIQKIIAFKIRMWKRDKKEKNLIQLASKNTKSREFRTRFQKSRQEHVFGVLLKVTITPVRTKLIVT